MDRELEIVEKMIVGKDPVGGGVLETPRDYCLDKARIAYFEQLLRVCQSGTSQLDGKRHSDRSYRKGNQGETWTAADEDRLRVLWSSSEQLTCNEIGQRLGRTEVAIVARLVHLGQFKSRNAVREANQQRVSTRSLPGASES